MMTLHLISNIFKSLWLKRYELYNTAQFVEIHHNHTKIIFKNAMFKNHIKVIFKTFY